MNTHAQQTYHNSTSSSSLRRGGNNPRVNSSRNWYKSWSSVSIVGVMREPYFSPESYA